MGVAALRANGEREFQGSDEYNPSNKAVLKRCVVFLRVGLGLGETLSIGREIERMLNRITLSTKRGGLGVHGQTKKMNTLDETT